ncbi:hypothetical protein B0T18DRAFT_237726 [Schizothecium vesticola]|uniref:Uncharacterized protein n=1 Tax=Schizothecium vesticola TaxID=314040 RepID=A0AA40BPR2_9PEZI|nr:hypothetical protein B0T18DRAFT_237726 [Schizothecium vesticola]
MILMAHHLPSQCIRARRLGCQVHDMPLVVGIPVVRPWLVSDLVFFVLFPLFVLVLLHQREGPDGNGARDDGLDVVAVGVAVFTFAVVAHAEHDLVGAGDGGDGEGGGFGLTACHCGVQFGLVCVVLCCVEQVR